MESSTDIIGMFARYEPYLQRLGGDSVDRRALAREMDCSRSTVYRSLQALVDAGVASESAGWYELLPWARIAYRGYERFASDVDMLLGSVRLFEQLDTDHLPIEVVRDARYVGPLAHAPDHPVTVTRTSIEEADRVSGLLPVTDVATLDMYLSTESVSKGDELIISSRAQEYLETQERTQLHDLMAENGELVWTTTLDVNFGLWLLRGSRDQQIIVVHDEEGRLIGSLVNDSPLAVAWAYEVLSSHRCRVKPVD